MRNCRVRNTIIGMVCVAIILSGCATMNENTAGRTTGTAVGALGGALIGYKQGGLKGAILGGILGGAAGYAVGWFVDDYTAKKTKSAQEVREQYARAVTQQAVDPGPEQTSHEKKTETAEPTPTNIPKEPEVYAYTVSVSPDDTILRGNEGEIITSFDLITEDGSAVLVEEERTIISPDGNNLLKKRYPYKEVDGSGGYEFRRKFPVRKDVEQGKYAISSKLYVNGKEFGNMDSGVQIVSRESLRLIAGR